MSDAHSTTFLVDILLRCIHREYPNRQTHVLRSDEDVLPPRTANPSFYGCFDWHSAVHSHWSLVRLWRLNRDAEFVPRLRSALEISFASERIDAELAFQQRPGRATFEMPYGGAWLLQLWGELREFAASAEAPSEVVAWSERLDPLAKIYKERFSNLLDRLPCPIRTGEHPQTAFNLGLVRDVARQHGDDALVSAIDRRALEFYAEDRGAPLAYEPGAYDFLSPVLAEADLMRRVLPNPEFRAWLQGFLGTVPREDWLEPVKSTDPSDGKLAHFDGLNLSRAWMQEGIASVLADGSRERRFFEESAAEHRAAGVAAVTGEHYAGAHWLATFVIYLVTRRGLSDFDAATRDRD